MPTRPPATLAGPLSRRVLSQPECVLRLRVTEVKHQLDAARGFRPPFGGKGGESSSRFPVNRSTLWRCLRHEVPWKARPVLSAWKP